MVRGCRSFSIATAKTRRLSNSPDRSGAVSNSHGPCKQSGQPYFPVIEKVTGIGDLAGMMSGFNAVYLADRGGGDIASVSTAGDERGVLGIVGPEGGFTDEETKIIISSGAKRVTLGPNRLRADTAAVCLAFGLLAAYR